MSKKALIIVLVIISIIILVFVGGNIYLKNKFKEIDSTMEWAEKELKSKIMVSYGIDEEQCMRAFAGIFIISSLEEEALKKIFDLKEDSKEDKESTKKILKEFKKLQEGYRISFLFISGENFEKYWNNTEFDQKQLINIFAHETEYPKMKPELESIVTSYIEKHKKREDLLRKLVPGESNQNIVEGTIAFMPKVYGGFLAKYTN